MSKPVDATPPVQHITALFEQRFAVTPTRVIRSPGRVNLIGDHTDYNDGFVLPLAINQALWLAARPRPDRRIQLVSAEQGDAMLDLDDLHPGSGWADYVAGAIWALDPNLSHGWDIAVMSDIPPGAGLSSSAALELAVARLVYAEADIAWNPVAAALACQRAENEFVGMPCGIMDQLIVATGRAGHVCLIDCRTLETQFVPLVPGTTVVILDTGTRRQLVDSAYEQRRSACQRVAARLGVAALRDVTLEMLDAGAGLDETDRRRARHVITENQRTVLAARALATGDATTVGRLMNESHVSLRDAYETSSLALDTMVDAARAQPACLGARVTGAGFAGCAVALVISEGVAGFIAAVSTRYRSMSGIEPALYPTGAAAGVEVVDGRWPAPTAPAG